MTIFTWPLTKWIPSRGTFRPRPISILSTSPYTAASKSAGNGSVWVAEQTFPSMETNEAHEFQAFLDLLEQSSNPVWIPCWPKPFIRAYNPFAGQPWSDGTYFTDGTGWSDPAWNLVVGVAALAGSRVVTMSGFPASQPVLYPGDVVSIGNSAIEITSAVLSDGGGVAMVPFIPGLRSGVEAGTPVVYVNPKILVRLTQDSNSAVEREVVNSTPTTLRFIEAVDLL